MLQLTSCEVLQFFRQMTDREQESQYFIVSVYLYYSPQCAVHSARNLYV